MSEATSKSTRSTSPQLSIYSARLPTHGNTDSPDTTGFYLNLSHTTTIVQPQANSTRPLTSTLNMFRTLQKICQAAKDHFRKYRQHLDLGRPVQKPPPRAILSGPQLDRIKALIERGNTQANALNIRARTLIDLSHAYRREKARLTAEMERQVRQMNHQFSLADLNHIIALYPEDDSTRAAAVEFHDVLEWLNSNERAMRQGPAVSDAAYHMATWNHSAHLAGFPDMYPNSLTIEQLEVEAAKVEATLEAVENKVWLMRRELDSIVAVARLVNGLGGRWDPFAHMLKKELY
uniref:Uncharacterized protein n=1 Tax=Podospora anserina TaxID=2587412 RepID=W6SL87_PODAS|nr:Putative protein of unknown function [Podospora anserina]